MSETEKMSNYELCEMALKLAEERTNGSQPALYLLVERMRPVLVAMVQAWQEHGKKLAEVEVRQDKIEESLALAKAEATMEIAALRAERDEWKRRAQAHGCDVERGDADCG